MKFKNQNIGLALMQVQIFMAIVIAGQVYSFFGVEMVITSVNDSTHKKGSFHYLGKAVDLRIKNIPSSKLQPLFQLLKKSLTRDFDVILETDHIHIEYDPKT